MTRLFEVNILPAYISSPLTVSFVTTVLLSIDFQFFANVSHRVEIYSGPTGSAAFQAALLDLKKAAWKAALLTGHRYIHVSDDSVAAKGRAMQLESSPSP